MLHNDSKLPLYIQLKRNLINKIKTGELAPGSMVPTEQDLCKVFGVSRFPVRQAMEELVEEGYLERTRGRGTFVSEHLPVQTFSDKKKLAGILLGSLSFGLNSGILSGFEKQCRERGYLTCIGCSEGNAEEELKNIDRMVEQGVSGISIFPCDGSRLAEKLPYLKEKGVRLVLLDRDAGITEQDYVGSDNTGGAYSAVRHLVMQGYRNVVFVSDHSNVSSVNERMEGYLRAVKDFGLNSVPHISIQEDLGKYPYSTYRFFLDNLKEELLELKKHMPVGVFAINDWVAFQCMRILMEEGIEIGKEIGLIGFDNEKECEMAPVPLTSVAQNGLLIGRSAVDVLLDKIENKTTSLFRIVIPTQMVVRNSCNERGK